MAINVGLLGELQVEQRLVEEGWHPVRLDTAQMAINADLFAVKQRLRVAIQVKTTKATGHSHAGFIGFGYAANHLKEGHSIFNSKESPLVADIIVGVNYSREKTRFIVLPVAFAEKLCRRWADYWYNTPLLNGGHRTVNFPLYLCLSANRGTHTKHHDQMKRNLLAFEDAWHILSEPIEKLHDSKKWIVLR
jgi:hypothetical protein